MLSVDVNFFTVVVTELTTACYPQVDCDEFLAVRAAQRGASWDLSVAHGQDMFGNFMQL